MVLCEAVQLKHPENFVYLCQEWRRVKMTHIVDEVILKTFVLQICNGFGVPLCVRVLYCEVISDGLCTFLSEEAPASPSTRDAIQGMLSMANPPSSSSSSSSSSPLSISGGLTEGLGVVKEKGGKAVWVTGGVKKTANSEKKPVIQRPGKRPIKRPARHLSDEESPDEQETLGTCFKDSDYGEQYNFD